MRRSSVRFRQAAPRKAPGQEPAFAPGGSVVQAADSSDVDAELDLPARPPGVLGEREAATFVWLRLPKVKRRSDVGPHQASERLVRLGSAALCEPTAGDRALAGEDDAVTRLGVGDHGCREALLGAARLDLFGEGGRRPDLVGAACDEDDVGLDAFDRDGCRGYLVGGDAQAPGVAGLV